MFSRNDFKSAQGCLKNLFFFTILPFAIFNCCSNPSTPPRPPIQPETTNDKKVTIYYGLNDSHSNHWVQQANNGFIGVVYGIFSQNPDGHRNSQTGNLIYRTFSPAGTEEETVVITDRGVDKSVLLYDSKSQPNIFYARSSDTEQSIFYLYQSNQGDWLKETVISFSNEGGKFIYEMSADIANDNSFHLLLLKTGSNPDSEDFMNCYQDAHLYYLTNITGEWKRILIRQYDTLYNDDMVVKTQRRQDIVVDNNGYAHIVYGEQFRPIPQDESTKAILHYVTNKSTSWVSEIALKSEADSDDAGWYPSLDLDKSGRPVLASTYVARVKTRSAKYAQLWYSIRIDENKWQTTVVCEEDDGYHGSDGRCYTGALPHLKIDSNNIPHIVFCDIASSHDYIPIATNPQNIFSTGQIRYAVFNGSTWDVSTIYRQPSPLAFYQGSEMFGQCLVFSNDGEQVQVVGQEMISSSENVYTNNLVHFKLK